MVCAFFHSGRCTILTESKCSEKCKFRKTEDDLIINDLIVKKTLEDKGLEKILIHTDEGPKISVRKKNENKNY